MRLFKKQYQADLKKVGSEEEITQLAKKKRGRPLTLGNIDEKVQQYIRALRKAGTPVNARVVLAAAEGIVKATDRTLLLENSGHIKLYLRQIKKAVKDGKIPPELVINWDQTGVNIFPVDSSRERSCKS